MPTIYFVDGEKGGVGKSMFSRVLAHFFECKKLDYILVDTDSSNDVANCYQGVTDITFKVADEELALSSLQVQKIDEIFNYAQEKSVLVNLPANVHEQVKFWLTDSCLLDLEFTQEANVNVVKWFVCSGEPDSFQYFLNSMEELGGAVPHVLVRNKGLHPDWKDVDNNKDYKTAKDKYKFLEIDFPGLRKSEQIYVQKSQLSFNNLIGDKALGLLSKQRLKNFLKLATEAIQESKVIAEPPPPSKSQSKRSRSKKTTK